MLKLVRVALTAAILIALGVRLRRRARRPSPVPPPAPAVVEARGRTGMLLAWAAILGIVALVLVIALVPARGSTEDEPPEGEWPTPSSIQPTPTPIHPTPTPMNATPSSTTAMSPTDVEATPQALGVQTTCTPARRPVTIRPIDPAVRRQVTGDWRRIERWLRKNAPVTYRTLGDPGRARTIAVAESQMGVDFPDDLRASLLRHNGRNDGVFAGGLDLTIRQIRDTWRGQCRVDGQWWQAPGKIPFQYRGEARWAVVDAESGQVGWNDGPAEAGVASFTLLLRTTADALERGGGLSGWMPRVKDGVLQWVPEH
ncbi:SMI1/KNR4 family protein [Nonomuraea sp. NPDC050790]|uniref:SMI1/KNR4 family protein n=1 Tax=Nonomuraea sp. NPDC050790 TaxID=3364371 RepID=UPI0037BA909E